MSYAIHAKFLDPVDNKPFQHFIPRRCHIVDDTQKLARILPVPFPLQQCLKLPER